ncbi:MAG: energy transducer TonB [Salinivirgaceae bacterium]|jgi:protein TonB|nr:energy transducer TonB [Salinivirgaceae bacterium]
METKKSKKADAKSKRVLFFEIGMIASLAIVLVAFQWTTKEKLMAMNLSNDLSIDIEDVWMPINTEMDKPKEEAPQPQPVDVIEIVEDDENIDDIFIADAEGYMNIPIQIIAMDDEPLDETEPEIFIVVEDMPVYPGGDKALLADIMSRVVYPEIAKENGIQGRVFVQFIVDSKGKVANVKVVRAIDSSLDREAVRVIQSLRGWTPGKQRGKAVCVSFTVPINFQLN